MGLALLQAFSVGFGFIALVVVVSTFAWFVPNIIRLYSKDVLAMSADELRSLTRWWVGLNWVRVVVYVAGWLSALQALSIQDGRGRLADA